MTWKSKKSDRSANRIRYQGEIKQKSRNLNAYCFKKIQHLADANKKMTLIFCGVHFGLYLSSMVFFPDFLPRLF